MFHNAQKGSALVLAIFIIVVMTVLGAALTRMMSSSAETIAYEALGTRAYMAAQSGVEWKLQQLFPLGSNSQVNCSTAMANIPPDISTTEGLKSCQIQVNNPADWCTQFDNDGTRYYTVVSTGQCFIEGDGGDIIELTSRTIEVEARSLQR